MMTVATRTAAKTRAIRPPLTPTASRPVVTRERLPIALLIESRIAIPATAPLALLEALRRRFTLLNPVYDEAERYDRDTRDLAPTLRYYKRRSDGALLVPRGAAEIVHQDCLTLGLEPCWTNETHLAPPMDVAERVVLSPSQERAVGEVLSRRMGVLEAPAGSGKTVMAMVLIARRRQPALVIVHTRELVRQAVSTAVAVLGLPEDEIGLIGDGQCRIGRRLTVALVQTLARGIPPALLDVGHVVVDECHHAPAEQVAAVLAQFPARYLLGLTATPYRRDGLDAVIGFYLGPTVARIDRSDLADRLIRPRIIKQDTGCRVRGDGFTTLIGRLVTDGKRNALIVADVAAAVATGRRCLVLSDRVAHVEQLTRLLTAQSLAAAALHGGLGDGERSRVVEALAAGDLAVVVATGALVGEGFNCPRLDALFLATPVSYAGRVVQYAGRVSRTALGKVDAVVFDYCDDHPMLWASWKKRRDAYRELGCAA